MPKLRKKPKNPFSIPLRQWREAHNPPLTLEALGNRFKPPVEKAQIKKWEDAAENGQISFWNVAEYAQALGLTYRDVLYPPSHGPSLDAMAEPLKSEAKEAIRASILAMGGRKAS